MSDFVYVKHTGEKDARDRTPLKRLWKPGDVKLVSAADAKALTRFVEFAVVEAKPDEQELQKADMEQKTQDKQAAKEKRTIEDVHFSIDQMDKDALETYAKKYGVELDKRRSVDTLRREVSGLIELHGAM